MGLPHLHTLLTLHRPPSPPDFRHTAMSDREGAKSRSPSAPSSHIMSFVLWSSCFRREAMGLSPSRLPSNQDQRGSGNASCAQHSPHWPSKGTGTWEAPLQRPLAVLLGICTESRGGPLTSLGWQRTLPGGEDTEGSCEGVCGGGSGEETVRKDKEGSRRRIGLGSTKSWVKRSRGSQGGRGGSHFRVWSSGRSGGESRKKRH